jgi:hypothetical protein
LKENDIADKLPGRPSVFVIGVSFLVLAAFQIKTKGHSTATSIYLLLGCYNLWQEGYRKDTSDWKVKPTPVLVLFFATWMALIYGIVSRENARKQVLKKQEIPYIEKLARQYNFRLPSALNGEDTLFKVDVRDENTLEFFYRIHKNTSVTKPDFKEQFMKKSYLLLKNKLDSLPSQLIKEYKENNLGFCHRFLDQHGEAFITIVFGPSDY